MYHFIEYFFVGESILSVAHVAKEVVYERYPELVYVRGLVSDYLPPVDVIYLFPPLSFPFSGSSSSSRDGLQGLFRLAAS